MARRIRPEDVQTVKERASLEEVVRDHVTLRGGGVGTLKGLCPFHDEKTPSFTVRPAVGYFHCFGCGEGGDVLDFVQKVDHLTFSESVERLADRLGITLRYDETGGGRGDQGPQVPTGQRTRLMEAHRVAEEFYHEALLRSPEGRAARDFMRGKGFDADACSRFMVGYSPNGGETLVRHLRGKGFTEEELVVGGLAGRGSRGLYDRFRGRVMWPIRSIAGDTVGFGARRLYDDDRIAAKYLNTAETPIYRKTGVLYGLDLAKKAIATERRAVVVEGYTDVMAAHLSGVGTAVATCGTAFASDHITILRRILRDEAGQAPARVIFTFDGDAAGQKAAMKAFEQDQRWAAQSFVAVAEDGQDPNDLWLRGGPEAVQALVDGARPMFEFAVRTTLAPYDLGLAQERVQAMRAVAPILAGVKDTTLRPEYVREVAGWMGVDPTALGAEVARAGRAPAAGPRPLTAGQVEPGPRPGGERPDRPGTPRTAPPVPRPDLSDPVQVAERNLLQVALQYPLAIVAEDMDELSPGQLRAPMHQAVWHGLQQAGGVRAAAGMSAATWNQAVLGQTPPLVHPLVQELAVAPLPTRLDPVTGMPPEAYVDTLVLGIRLATLEQRIAATLGQIQRGRDDSSAEARRLNEELMGLHRERAALKDRMS
ncbi:DNA primase [Ornithinimicrobium pekingense]|uniref:DNA primase n=1 Tax=Ornithinimicrobium pekingense TaxID=384677 RepID=A0ABQ2F5N2_9MICO|nr:DNA primase [Ornithinimicrobium pekingense]GGK61394.1 DNA primase [Ornithinimicrobium pekingense]